MPELHARSEELARSFEAAAAGFEGLVQSLSAQQWRMTGRNHPTIRAGDEDEGRPVAVIAFHTANSMRNQLGWVAAMARGEQPTPPDRGANARQAVEKAGVEKAEVLALLDEMVPRVAAMIRGFGPEQMERRAQTLMGESSVAEVVERVVIGHVRWHQGSIEATIVA